MGGHVTDKIYITDITVIWALAGIILKRNHDYTSIVIIAAIGIFILAITTIHGFFKATRST
jgi:hypothetical protein